MSNKPFSSLPPLPEILGAESLKNARKIIMYRTLKFSAWQYISSDIVIKGNLGLFLQFLLQLLSFPKGWGEVYPLALYGYLYSSWKSVFGDKTVSAVWKTVTPSPLQKKRL